MMDSEGYRILDKLLSGEYSFQYIVFGIILFALGYIIYLNKDFVVSRIKDNILAFWYRKNYADYFLKSTHAFAHLEQNLSTAQSVATGDYVKDMLLKDIAEIISDVTKKKVVEYLNSINPNDNTVNDIKHQTDLLMQNIYNGIKESIICSIPARVVSKLITLFQDIELISMTQLSYYEIDGEGTIELLKHNIKSICISYATMIQNLCNSFHRMNGDLNGIFYKDYIVGVYDSSRIPKGNYPLPNKQSESDANLFAVCAKSETGCSAVSLLVFHDSSFDITTTEEVGNRIVSMIYSFENYIDKSGYQRMRLLTLIDSNRIQSMLENKCIFADRDQEPEFSRLRNFISENNLNKVIIQPVLRNKEELIGILVLGWTDNDKIDYRFVEGKLHGLASRCVRFFSYWEN